MASSSSAQTTPLTVSATSQGASGGGTSISDASGAKTEKVVAMPVRVKTGKGLLTKLKAAASVLSSSLSEAASSESSSGGARLADTSDSARSAAKGQPRAYRGKSAQAPN